MTLQFQRCVGLVGAVAGLILLSLPATTRADDSLLNLDIDELLNVEIISSASKYDQTTKSAPASVSVITRQEIELLGYRTVSEVIRGVRGFYTTNDYSYNYTGVRGFGRPSDYDTRLLVMVNGHRLNEAVYDSATLGYDSVIDIDSISRIEIVRGPGSSLYGTNAFFGVINIITRNAKEVGNGEIATSVGSFDNYRGRGTVGHVFEGGTEAVFSVSGGDNHGAPKAFYPEFADTESGGWAYNLDEEKDLHLFGQIKFRTITVESGYSTRSKSAPTAAYGSDFNDPQYQSEDDRYYLDIKSDYDVSSDLLIKSRAFYDWYSYSGKFPYAESFFDDSTNIVVASPARGEHYGFDIETFYTGVKGHTIVSGVDFKQEDRVRQRAYSEEPFLETLDVNRDTINAGIYLQDDYTLTNEVSIHFGLRYDKYERRDGETSPRGALIWQADKDTAVKLLAGRAFRAPTDFEMYYEDGGASFKSNPNVGSEYINNYEAVLEHSFAQNYRATVDVYWYEIQGLISQVNDPNDGLGVFTNLEEVHARGAEFELEGRWLDGWSFRTSYSFQENEEQNSKIMLSNSPRHLWKNQLIAPLVDERLFAGFELLYSSQRKTLTDANLESYWLANLTITLRNVANGVSLAGGMYNMFSENYSDPGSIEHTQDKLAQYGRTWQIKATYSF